MAFDIVEFLKDPAVYGWAAVIGAPIYFAGKKVITKIKSKIKEKSRIRDEANNLTKAICSFFDEQLVDVDFWGQSNVDNEINQLIVFLKNNTATFGDFGTQFENLIVQYNHELNVAPERNNNDDDNGLFGDEDEEYSFYPEYEDKKVKEKIREIIELLNQIKGA